METILSVSQLEKSYAVRQNIYPVLKGINLSIRKGEFVAIMGPSGSGKTTLLNVLSGFLESDNGTVKIGGVDMTHADKMKQAEIRAKVLGFIFQDFMLIDALTVQENIFLPQIIAGKSSAAMENKTDELLSFFEIENISEKYPVEISGGQKQRAAIARALSNDPVLVLADEPTGNLDSKSGQAVIEAFLQAKEYLGATVMMVTHDAAAASSADRVIVLSDGIIMEELVRHNAPRQFLNDIFEFMKVLEADYDNR